MTEETAYRPQEIPDQPFPQEGLPPTVSQASAGEGVYTPEVVKDKEFPVKRVAVELLSSALNTRSKRIIQEFQFTESGAIQVGKYQAGVTGDVRISPVGIVARDSAGNLTLVLDGETGDAVFRGEIRSGSLVSGKVTVGNNSVIIDGKSQTIIVNDGTTDRVLIGKQVGGF